MKKIYREIKQGKRTAFFDMGGGRLFWAAVIHGVFGRESGFGVRWGNAGDLVKFWGFEIFLGFPNFLILKSFSHS